MNVSTVTLSPHAGTHADSPLHVTEGGAGSETLDIAAFNGPALVVDVSGITGEIGLDDLRLESSNSRSND